MSEKKPEVESMWFPKRSKAVQPTPERVAPPEKNPLQELIREGKMDRATVERLAFFGTTTRDIPEVARFFETHEGLHQMIEEMKEGMRGYLRGDYAQHKEQRKPFELNSLQTAVADLFFTIIARNELACEIGITLKKPEAVELQRLDLRWSDLHATNSDRGGSGLNWTDRMLGRNKDRDLQKHFNLKEDIPFATLFFLLLGRQIGESENHLAPCFYRMDMWNILITCLNTHPEFVGESFNNNPAAIFQNYTNTFDKSQQEKIFDVLGEYKDYGSNTVRYTEAIENGRQVYEQVKNIEYRCSQPTTKMQYPKTQTDQWEVYRTPDIGKKIAHATVEETKKGLEEIHKTHPNEFKQMAEIRQLAIENEQRENLIEEISDLTIKTLDRWGKVEKRLADWENPQPAAKRSWLSNLLSKPETGPTIPSKEEREQQKNRFEQTKNTMIQILTPSVFNGLNSRDEHKNQEAKGMLKKTSLVDLQKMLNQLKSVPGT